LSSLSVAAEHDVTDGIEKHRRRTGSDHRPQHLLDDRIGNSRRAELRDKSPRQSQRTLIVRISTRRSDIVPSVLGLQQPLRHSSDVQSTSRRFSIFDGRRNTLVRPVLGVCGSRTGSRTGLYTGDRPTISLVSTRFTQCVPSRSQTSEDRRRHAQSHAARHTERNGHASRARLETNFEFERQGKIRDTLQVSAILLGLRTGVDQDTSHHFLHSATVHASFCAVLQRAETECRVGFRIGIVQASFYRKTVVNVRKRSNVRLIADPHKLARAAGKATFKRSEIINSDLVLVEMERSKIVLNKPIAIGFTILEYAQLVMFHF